MEALEYEAAFENQAMFWGFFFFEYTNLSHFQIEFSYRTSLEYQHLVIYQFSELFLSLKADDSVHLACIEVNLLFLPCFLLEATTMMMIFMALRFYLEPSREWGSLQDDGDALVPSQCEWDQNNFKQVPLHFVHCGCAGHPEHCKGISHDHVFSMI